MFNAKGTAFQWACLLGDAEFAEVDDPAAHL